MNSRRPRSLLEELSLIASKHDSEMVIESRATHIIESATNLLDLIRETFDPDIAYDLERRFINSIKSGDSSKFTRGIRKQRDEKSMKKTLKIITNPNPK